MDKKQKKRLVIRDIARKRGVSLAVAAHIYCCWPRKKQQKERSKIALETT